MTVRRVMILCNAMSDPVRTHREITTDSPAATRKIVMMMQALRSPGVRPTIISLGRGRQDGSGRDFPAVAGRIAGIPVAYGRFVNRPVLSELRSLFAPLPILWSRRRRARATTLLLYNRMWSHVPALWFARALGYRTMLDLEDGAIGGATRPSVRSRLLMSLIDPSCRNGALLACSALAAATQLRPAEPFYGIVDARGTPRDFSAPVVHALIGGTVGRITGADMLLDAVALLRTGTPELAKQLHLHVSGSGDLVPAFHALAADPGPLQITVHGRLTDAEYRELLDACSMGFALKPNGGPLADTTFPSKVVELAGAGMLVVTTDISDVRAVLGEGAVYLTRNDAATLRDLIAGVLTDRARSARIAQTGQGRVRDRCGREAAAMFLSRFVTRSGAGA